MTLQYFFLWAQEMFREQRNKLMDDEARCKERRSIPSRSFCSCAPQICHEILDSKVCPKLQKSHCKWLSLC